MKQNTIIKGIYGLWSIAMILGMIENILQKDLIIVPLQEWVWIDTSGAVHYMRAQLQFVVQLTLTDICWFLFGIVFLLIFYEVVKFVLKMEDN